MLEFYAYVVMVQLEDCVEGADLPFLLLSLHNKQSQVDICAQSWDGVLIPADL